MYKKSIELLKEYLTILWQNNMAGLKIKKSPYNMIVLSFESK